MLRGICKVQLDDSPEHSLTEFRCEDCTVVKGACRNRQNAAAMAEERRQREENGETLPPERPAKPQRAERPARSERAPRSERPERQPKGERPPRPEKPERPARGERQPRPEKPERIEKNANPAETGENAAAEPREGAPRRRSRGGRRHRRPQNGENAPAPSEQRRIKSSPQAVEKMKDKPKRRLLSAFLFYRQKRSHLSRRERLCVLRYLKLKRERFLQDMRLRQGALLHSSSRLMRSSASGACCSIFSGKPK